MRCAICGWWTEEGLWRWGEWLLCAGCWNDMYWLSNELEREVIVAMRGC